MAGDRGQKTGGHGPVFTIIIVGVVAYVAYNVMGPVDIPTNVILGVLGLVVLLVAALAAYGAWLIGRGSEAEMQARAKAGQRNVDRLADELEQSGQGGFRERPEASGDSTVMSTGWTALDLLRTGNIPYLSRLEDRLGWGDDDD